MKPHDEVMNDKHSAATISCGDLTAIGTSARVHHHLLKFTFLGSAGLSDRRKLNDVTMATKKCYDHTSTNIVPNVTET